MSSSSSTKWLSTADMWGLQRVLNDAGFDAKIVISDDVLPGATAKLSVKLLSKGSAAHFRRLEHLEVHFGRNSRAVFSPQISRLHRYAIQGLPAPGGSPPPSMV